MPFDFIKKIKNLVDVGRPMTPPKLPALQDATPYDSMDDLDEAFKNDAGDPDANIWSSFNHISNKKILGRFNQGSSKDLRESYELMGFAAQETALENAYFLLHSYQVMTAPDSEKVPLFRALADEYFPEGINVSSDSLAIMGHLNATDAADLTAWKRALAWALKDVTANLHSSIGVRGKSALTHEAKIERKRQTHAAQQGKKGAAKKRIKDKRTFDEYMHTSAKLHGTLHFQPRSKMYRKDLSLGGEYRRKIDRNYDDATFNEWLSKFEPSAKKFQWLTPKPLPSPKKAAESDAA